MELVEPTERNYDDDFAKLQVIHKKLPKQHVCIHVPLTFQSKRIHILTGHTTVVWYVGMHIRNTKTL